jgi:drug/metabolite transporter (DMT)-like permease
MDRVELRYWLLRICPLAFLFCVNIILGNVSLRYIPVSFMQTIKSSVPACTVLFQWTLLRERVPAPVALSLIPIVGGVMLATYTEVNFHPIGFWAAVLASFATAGSAILNGIVLTTKLNPMSLVFYMAPPSLALLLPLIWAQERDALVTHFASGQADARVPSVLIISGLIAFLLNLSSFWVIKRTSPLTFTVAGNFKVVLSIVFSVMIFRNEIGPLNSLGCLTAILGVAYYNQLRFRINQEAQRLKATQQQQQQQQQQLQVQQSSSVQSTAIDLAAADAVSPNLMEKLADKV